MALNLSDEKSVFVLRQLVLAKQFFLHGTTHHQGEDDLNRMLAIHHYHIAVELALKAIGQYYAVPIKQHSRFDELLGEIDNYAPFVSNQWKIPCRAKLDSLNNFRNQAQHDALPPAQKAMEECRFYAEEALRAMCQTYFGEDFDELNQLSLVKSQELRVVLEKALRAIISGNNEFSVLCSYCAYLWASEAVLKLATSSDLEVIEPYGKKVHALAEKVIERTTQLKQDIAMLSSGINLLDFRKLKQLRPKVSFAAAGNMHWNRCGPNSLPTKDDAEWAHGFVTDVIIKWQLSGLAPQMPSFYAPGFRQLIELAQKEIHGEEPTKEASS